MTFIDNIYDIYDVTINKLLFGKIFKY